MPFGGLHWYDLLVLVGLALLVFGPKRLPEMGSAVGKTIKEFQRSMREVTEGPKNEAPAIPPPAPAQTSVTEEPSTASPAAPAVASTESKAE
jgi:TatA/E family protein of Tat protein translocase